MRTSGKKFLLAVLVFAGAAFPQKSYGQEIEVTPSIGMYIPVGLLVEGHDVTDNSAVRRRQLGALLIGASIGLNTTRTLGIELSGTYSPTMVAITDRDSTLDISAGVLMASLRGVARVSGKFSRGRWGFYVAPGIGVVRRHGVAWSESAGTTDRAVVLAGGARLGKLNSSRAFRFDVTNYITRASFEHSTERSPPRIHHDVVWSFGVALPVTP